MHFDGDKSRNLGNGAFSLCDLYFARRLFEKDKRFCNTPIHAGQVQRDRALGIVLMLIVGGVPGAASDEGNY